MLVFNLRRWLLLEIHQHGRFDLVALGTTSPLPTLFFVFCMQHDNSLRSEDKSTRWQDFTEQPTQDNEKYSSLSGNSLSRYTPEIDFSHEINRRSKRGKGVISAISCFDLTNYLRMLCHAHAVLIHRIITLFYKKLFLSHLQQTHISQV